MTKQTKCIICRKCNSENEANLEKCQKCGQDLLPGRSIGTRLLFLVVALGSAGLLIVAFTMGTIVAKAIFTIPLLGGFFGGLALTFSKTSVSDKYKLRGEKYIKSFPAQAVTDFNKAIENLSDSKGDSKYELIDKRGDAYKELADFSNALKDFEECEQHYKINKSNELGKIVIKIEQMKAKLAQNN